MKKRAFILSFAVAFLVLAVLVAGLIFLVTHAQSNPSASSSQTEPGAYLPKEKDRMTVFFVGANKKDPRSETFFLIRFNPVDGEIPVLGLVPELIVDNNGKPEALATVCAEQGVQKTRDILAKSLGIPIDRYVKMDLEAFIKAADLIGTVEYRLGQDLNYTDESMSVKLSRGLQQLDGKKTSDIIRYPQYEGGPPARMRNSASLAAEIINQKIGVVETPLVDTFFSAIINLVESDMSYVDYDDRREAARFLAGRKYDAATAVPFSGSYNTAQNSYTLSESTKKLILQLFG